jgi:hypothetical protein
MGAGGRAGVGVGLCPKIGVLQARRNPAMNAANRCSENIAVGEHNVLAKAESNHKK